MNQAKAQVNSSHVNTRRGLSVWWAKEDKEDEEDDEWLFFIFPVWLKTVSVRRREMESLIIFREEINCWLLKASALDLQTSGWLIM